MYIFLNFYFGMQETSQIHGDVTEQSSETPPVTLGLRVPFV